MMDWAPRHPGTLERTKPKVSGLTVIRGSTVVVLYVRLFAESTANTAEITEASLADASATKT